MNYKNKVLVNTEGIIEIHVVGDQTRSSVQAMGDEAKKLATKLRAEHKPALVLDNLLAIGAVPAEARRLVVALVKSSDYDKLAMLGSGALIKLGANLILQATGRGGQVRYFDKETEALSWLTK
jgi:hypothetical protein